MPQHLFTITVALVVVLAAVPFLRSDNATQFLKTMNTTSKTMYENGPEIDFSVVVVVVVVKMQFYLSMMMMRRGNALNCKREM